MIKALLVDDEPLAHDVILHHLKAHSDIDVVGQCVNAAQALGFLANNTIDLLFLDINMPELSGIDMLKVLANMPQVIIVSAYQEYALQGFELNVTDYLLKPVSAERLQQALDKVRDRLDHLSTPIIIDEKPSAPEHIVLKVDRGQRKFEFNEITYLEAFGNYVKLWQGESMVLISSTLKNLLEQFPSQQFIQCHKSFVINRDCVIGLNTDSIELQTGHKIKVGKSFKPSLNGLFL
jgi:DNA-binding LytR/AlgR family response regulator